MANAGELQPDSVNQNNLHSDPDDDMSLDDLVQQYDSNRLIGDDGELIKRKNDFQHEEEKPKRNADVWITGHVSSEERTKAALVYLIPFLALPLSIFSMGFFIPFLFLLGFGVYAATHTNSPFIADHAKQSLITLLIGTVGFLAVAIGIPILGVIVTLALIISLVGILLVPFLWLFIALLLLVSLALPVSMLVFSIIGALKAWSGDSFSYPIPVNAIRRIGKRISRQDWTKWREYRERNRGRIRFH